MILLQILPQMQASITNFYAGCIVKYVFSYIYSIHTPHAQLRLNTVAGKTTSFSSKVCPNYNFSNLV